MAEWSTMEINFPAFPSTVPTLKVFPGVKFVSFSGTENLSVKA